MLRLSALSSALFDEVFRTDWFFSFAMGTSSMIGLVCMGRETPGKPVDIWSCAHKSSTSRFRNGDISFEEKQILAPESNTNRINWKSVCLCCLVMGIINEYLSPLVKCLHQMGECMFVLPGYGHN